MGTLRKHADDTVNADFMKRTILMSRAWNTALFFQNYMKNKNTHVFFKLTQVRLQWGEKVPYESLSGGESDRCATLMIVFGC